MIKSQEEIRQYLDDYHDGLIPEGLGIGIKAADDYIRYKQGEFTIVNGHDNVGKTVWLLWYFLVIAEKHGKTFTIWSGENKEGGLMRNLIQFSKGKYFKNLSKPEIYAEQTRISQYINFVDTKGFYSLKDLIKAFQDQGTDCNLIDPFTGLNRKFGHADNYEFLNDCRNYCNKTEQSLYVNTHINTEAARSFHTKESCNDDKSLIGYAKAPQKSQSEGGQPFANRPDGFLTIHRYVGHPDLGFTTEVYVRKVKDTDTGGLVSPINSPVYFDWNRGLGFTCDGQNPINNVVKDSYALSDLSVNNNFDKETSINIPKNDVPF